MMFTTSAVQPVNGCERRPSPVRSSYLCQHQMIEKEMTATEEHIQSGWTTHILSPTGSVAKQLGGVLRGCMSKVSCVLLPVESCLVVGAEDGIQEVGAQFTVHLLCSLCCRRRCEGAVGIVMQRLQCQVVDGRPDVAPPVRSVARCVLSLIKPAKHHTTRHAGRQAHRVHLSMVNRQVIVLGCGFQNGRTTHMSSFPSERMPCLDQSLFLSASRSSIRGRRGESSGKSRSSMGKIFTTPTRRTN